MGKSTHDDRSSLQDSAALRDELDAHLDGINENTAELAAVQEYVGELDMRLEKLAERIDALQALILSQTTTGATRSVRLSSKEREVLQALLAEGVPRTSREIGRRIGLTADMVAQALYCMGQKGVPVLTQTVAGEGVYALDPRFRQAQQERDSHLTINF